MDVGLTTEVGNHVGAFQLPPLPDLVLADILVLVELFSKIIAIVLFSKGVGEINPDLI